MLSAYKSLTWSVVNLVNAPRDRTFEQQRDKLLLKAEQRQQFANVGQQIVAARLALGSLGEISLRFSSHKLAITTKNSQLAQLTDKDIVTCPIELTTPQETAALHLNWHRLIYLETPAQAVMLGHPQYAITLANAGYLPNQYLMPELWQLIGDVTRLSLKELTDAILVDAVQKHPVVLLPQIGVLIWGNSLNDVLTRAEALEYVSQLTVIAHQNNLTLKSA